MHAFQLKFGSYSSLQELGLYFLIDQYASYNLKRLLFRLLVTTQYRGWIAILFENKDLFILLGAI